MDSLGFPALWSNEEYSFYFQLLFGDDYSKQQTYINKVLAAERISLNVGHRALAALIEIGLARVIFTTNFDEVIETAYAEVSGKSISPFHLEGSYAALSALNSENFPIYAKIHGDFKYRSIKNLSQDLKDNDSEIQKCFLAGTDRYGLVVTGYSGRDDNVMSMFHLALNQNNAFPQGLFWTVPKLSSTESSVIELIERAKAQGVNAHVVETGTFDIMLSRIWKQVENKPEAINSRVKKIGIQPVSIPMGSSVTNYPLLRTNALPILSVPRHCGCVSVSSINTYSDLIGKLKQNAPDAIVTYTDKVLFWGDSTEVQKLYSPPETAHFDQKDFVDGATSFESSTILKAFLDNALSSSLVEGRPYLLKRKRKGVYYIVVNHQHRDDAALSSLCGVLDYLGKPGYITGSVRGLEQTFWAESVSVKLDFRDGKLWLLLQPDVWISPMKNREEARDHLSQRKLRRYNNQSYHLLDAWIGILFGGRWFEFCRDNLSA